MQKRHLGNSGIEVGVIGLGCMGMSWVYGSTDQTQANRVINRAIDLGVTLFDTADIYGSFTNEEMLGRAIAGKRDKVILATKGGNVFDPVTRSMQRNGTPAHLKAACEASIKRLGVEVIDLYQLHRVDPQVPVEESVGAMAELVAAGKVRTIGLSECDITTLNRALKVHPIASLQSELSLWTKEVLAEILPWCKQNQVAFIPFAPLGRGFLTGAYRSVDVFDKTDFRTRLPRFQTGVIERNLKIVEQIEIVANRLNVTKAQIALAWVLAQGENVIPIPGTKKLEYLEENLQAESVRFTPEDLELLNQLPEPTGARY
jgi:aryl-alcohol dehydrogenase-like predicted oxidoreductase